MNGKLKIMVLPFYILLFTSILTGPVWGNIPQKEREALIALYNSTNGDNWSLWDNNWKTPPLHTDGFAMPGTECNWSGVTCDEGNTTVISIYLWGDNLDGPIPAQLGNLSNLETLSLGWNNLTGPIPRELGNLAKLESLYLYGDQLSASIPPELGNLSKLESLNLYDNQLTGSIPPELGNLSKLGSLSLSSNQLTGPIPPELGNLSKLESLSLSSNQLTGPIPRELGNLSELGWLYLDSNQLSGPIPVELGDLPKLYSLYLDSNQLSGAIPRELGNLSTLSWLYLDSNHLSGTIPPEMGSLSGLYSLRLSSNQLQGNIPPELGLLSNLRYLDLSSNQLTGAIPPKMKDLSRLWDNESDFRWNGLYTDDESLRDFLESKQIGWIWDNTQTVAPQRVNARGVSPTSVEVSWEPIAYSDEKGGYSVFYSQTPGGPYILGGVTGTKYDYRMEISELDPLIYYYFVVQTRTEPHQFNQNTLVSNYSAEVSSGTQGSDIIISGRVFEKTGKGLEGVTMTFSPSNRFEITDTNGNYRHAVRSGWTGTVTPAKTGYTFEPVKIEFENVTSDQPGKSFKASPISLAIKGRVTSGGEGIADVILTFVSQGSQPQTTATDQQGNYNHTVPYGWTGRVTPSKGSILFFPPYIDYAPPGVINVMDHRDYQLSVSLTLNVSREQDSTVIIKKEYGKIELQASLKDILPPDAVQSFVIYRKGANNNYEPITEFPAREPYQFMYEDKYLDKNTNYTYIGKALDAEGKVIGESTEKTI